MSTDNHNLTEPPLWSIGVAAGIILLTPLILYSLAPVEPLRDGDTVFSEGEQLVRINKPNPAAQKPGDNTCLLDPSSPLIVIHSPTTDPESSIIAEVQGNSAGDWPFCPVHAEVNLKIQQVFQRPAVLGTVREILVGLFSR